MQVVPPTATTVAGFTDIESLFASARTRIYTGRRDRDGLSVVMKCVAPGATDARARWRLNHEHQLLNSMDIPGVVRCHGLISSELGPTLLLEHLTGGPLIRLCGALVSVERCLDIGARVARVLAAVHGADITHRDINPTNVMWDEASGQVTLLDFGIATRLTREAVGAASDLRLEGTLGYLSPEQTGRTNRSVDRRTDLYSLGATLYELIAGQRPFESPDPVAILHATVARPARAVNELRPEVPGPVAEILARLLAKDAEHRYQDAAALADDLERCRDQLEKRGTIEPFSLGATDRRTTFSLPERLYGREAALAQLAAAAQETRSGRATILTVVGAAGAGKTALIRELAPRLGEAGLLASGVCEALERTPYRPLLQVLRGLLTRTLDGAPGALSGPAWIAALDGDAGLLAPLLPDLLELIGEIPDPPDLPASETRKRLLGGLTRLLRAGHADPLVLFFDDLQWVDPGSQEVLLQLIASPPAGRPLLIMAWRDGELSDDHPLAALLGDGASPVALSPLDPESVARMLAEATSLPVTDTQPLADRVHAKTAGNPFFVRQFAARLHADGLIHLDPSTSRWTWSLARIDALPPMDNVAQLLAAGLAALSVDVREVVGMAACVGKTFQIATVHALAGGSMDAVCRALLGAVEAGVLVPRAGVLGELEARASSEGGDGAPGGALRFVHDEVFDAARATVPADRRGALHLAAGRDLRARGADPFAVADQFNLAAELLRGDERRTVAQVNLDAGRRAQASAAFDAALHYLEAGIQVFDQANWSDHYAVGFGLHQHAAEALLMCPDHQAPVDFAGIALEHARDLFDRVAVQRLRILERTGRHELVEAVDLALEALRWVGVRLPQKAYKGHAAVALARTFWNVRGLDLARLRALPVSDDPQIAAALRLLSDTVPSAYYTNTNLLPILLCRMVDLSVQRGVAPHSAVGFATFAFLQIVVRKNLAAAQMWSTVARELVDRFDARALAPRVELSILGFVDSRAERIGGVIDGFQRASWQAREFGDAEYTALCAFNHSFYSWLAGVPLPELERRARADLETCEALGQGQSTVAVRSILQAIECLTGRAPDPGLLTGTYMRLDETLQRMADVGDQSSVASLLIKQVGVSLLFGDAPDALRHIERASAGLADLPGSPELPPFHFHAALVYVAAAREGDARARRAVQRHRKALAPWAEDGPDNHAHKRLLIDAEWADLRGEADRATALYDAAIRAARASGMQHEEAVCAEWAARASIRVGLHRRAGVLLREARSAWLAWGCTARVPVLDALEGRLPAAPNVSGRGLTGTLTRQTTSSLLSGTVDLDSVVRASQALSGEIRLSELLRVLMQIVLENAGATYGMLVLEEDGEPVVVATATALESGGVAVELPEHALTIEAVRPALAPAVRHVRRTQEPLVVHDGDTAGPLLGSDPPHSVLCVPIRKGRQRIGVVALENALARSAFTDDRHEIVGVLCSQAAVSIENARLYADLQHSLAHQKQLTAAFERFVPQQFLEALGRANVLEVALGDQVERDLTFLFMDIRGFTALSEGLSARRTFALVNALLARLGPIVRRHGGFIDKYIGDAIMALFPGVPDDALAAALDIQRAVAAVRKAAVGPPESELCVGVGVHYGVTMLGTVGEVERMDTTVISDAVNTASRLEGLTKKYGVEICVSGATLQAARDVGRFATRSLGRVDVRGRAGQIALYELISARAD